jgi:transposase-like protein
MVDEAGNTKVEGRQRLRRRIAEKRKVVEQAMLPGASVAAVARQYGVNANMVHYWRNLYRQGRLGEKKNDSIRLLPVRISESAATPVLEPEAALSPTTSVVPAPTAGIAECRVWGISVHTSCSNPSSMGYFCKLELHRRLFCFTYIPNLGLRLSLHPPAAISRAYERDWGSGLRRARQGIDPPPS